jgi:hypothetical protein
MTDVFVQPAINGPTPQAQPLFIWIPAQQPLPTGRIPGSMGLVAAQPRLPETLIFGVSVPVQRAYRGRAGTVTQVAIRFGPQVFVSGT